MKRPQLYNEYRVMKDTISKYKTQPDGIPEVYWYGNFGDYNVLVMECLGPSLETLFKRLHNNFSFKTSLMIADQMVNLFFTLSYLVLKLSTNPFISTVM